MFCGKCGNEVAEGNNFCTKCGEKLLVINENYGDVKGESICSENKKSDSSVGVLVACILSVIVIVCISIALPTALENQQRIKKQIVGEWYFNNGEEWIWFDLYEDGTGKMGVGSVDNEQSDLYYSVPLFDDILVTWKIQDKHLRINAYKKFDMGKIKEVGSDYIILESNGNEMKYIKRE